MHGTDECFLTLCRSVERNTLTARAVERAEDWPWGSLWARRNGPAELKAMLHDWPVERPRNWVQLVNEPMAAKEIEAIRTSVVRNRPFGSETWQAKTAAKLGLLHTLRSEGRPKMKPDEGDGTG